MIDAIERIEDIKRILEDRLHLAAERCQFRAALSGDRPAIIEHGAARRILEAEQKPDQRGFAAPAFTDHSRNSRTLAADGKRDVVEGGFPIAEACDEDDVRLAYLEKLRHVRPPPLEWSGHRRRGSCWDGQRMGATRSASAYRHAAARRRPAGPAPSRPVRRDTSHQCG